MCCLCVCFVKQGVNNKKYCLSTSKTVLQRLHENRVYPTVQTYKMDRMYTIPSTPPGFNGSKGDPVIFRWSNPMEVAISLLQKSSLHNDDEANFCFDPETVTDESGRRLYTRDVNSGNWWPRYCFVCLIIFLTTDIIVIICIYS